MKNSGMTAIEVLVVIAFVAPMILIIAHFSTTTFNAFSHIEKTSLIDDSFEELRATLRSSRECRLNLSGLPLKMGQSSPTTIADIIQHDKNGDSASPVVQTGKVQRGVLTESIVLEPKVQVDTALILADLKLNFSKTNTNIGPQKITRTLPIFARMKEGKIYECWTQNEKSAIEASQICLALTNGALDTFDKAAKKCVLASSKWFQGTFDRASCPKGTFLPKNAHVDYNCLADAGKDFNDGFPKTPTKMADGSIIDETREPVLTSLKNSACHCAWAVDLAASFSKFKCSILCIVPTAL